MNYKHLSVKKKTCTWIWTAVDHFKPGILGWTLGSHSAKTFEPLWNLISKWKCYFYVTDGCQVYPNFIPEGDQIPPQNLYDLQLRVKIQD